MKVKSFHKLLTFVSLVLFSAFSHPDTTPTQSDNQRLEYLTGHWKVTYQDKLLGRVDGTAVINHYQTEARVKLIHPQNGNTYEFNSTEFSRNGNELKLTLKGHWPGALDQQDPPLGAKLELPAAKPLTLSLGNASADFAVAPPDESEQQEIKLSLTLSEKSLSGIWSQKVRADTGRTSQNSGRTGQYTYLNDGSGQAEQQGAEFWYRPETKIRFVIPVSDQLSVNEIGGARYPYPWDENGKAIKSYPINHRLLFILGDGIPTEVGDPVKLESLNPDIEYQVYAKQYRFDDKITIEPTVKTAWQHIERKFYSAGKTAQAVKAVETLRELDGILVRVKIKPGASWGETGFKLNNSEAVWTLKYGDHVADLNIVRPVNDVVTEATDYLFAPERIQFELRTQAHLPGINRIPLVIGIDEKIQTFSLAPASSADKKAKAQETRKLMAFRLPVSERELERVQAAKKAGNKSAKPTVVFRTAPLALLTSNEPDLMPKIPSDRRLTVQPGNIVQARVATPGLITTTRGISRAQVLDSPASIAPTVAAKQGRENVDNNLTWLRAITQAAQCHDIPVTGPTLTLLRDKPGHPDVSTLLHKKVYAITDWLWTEIPWAAFRLSGGEEVLKLPGKISDASGLSDVLDTAGEYYSSAVGERTNKAYKVLRTTGLGVKWWFGRTDPDVSYSVNVLLGDHTAMLMVHDAFTELMRNQLHDLKKIKTEKQLWSFRKSVEGPIAVTDNHPVGDLKVKTPSSAGGKTETWFFYSYIDDAIIKDYNIEGDQLRNWQLQATREALSKYITAIEEALKRAEETDTCDVEAMIDLTTHGQDNVQRYLMGRLVTTAQSNANQGTQWKADHTARSWVLGLNILGGAVKAQENLNEQDTQLFLLATALGTAGAGAGAGLLGMEAATLAPLIEIIEEITFFYEILHEWDGYVDDKRELNFALGASAVIGPRRFQQAVDEDTWWFWRVYALSFNLIDFVDTTDWADVAKKLFGGRRLVSESASIKLGNELISGFSESAPVIAKKLPDPPINYTPPAPPTPQEAVKTAMLDMPSFDEILKSSLDSVPNPRARQIGTFSLNPSEADSVDTYISKLRKELITDAADAEKTIKETFENAAKQGKSADEGLFGELTGNALRERINGPDFIDELEKAVKEAREVGFSDKQIHFILKHSYKGGTNPTYVIDQLANKLVTESFANKGLQIVESHIETDIRSIMSRLLVGNVNQNDLKGLRYYINEAEQRGSDFFAELTSKGSYNPVDGFYPLADGATAQKAREFAEELGLVQRYDGSFWGGSADIRQGKKVTLADINNLDESQRLAILNAITHARRLEAKIGRAALETAEKEALELAEALGGFGKKPEWAKPFDDSLWESHLKHLANRADVDDFARNHNAAFTSIVNDPKSLDVLEGAVFDSFDDLNKAISKAKKRLEDPLEGFAEAAVRDDNLPNGIFIEDVITEKLEKVNRTVIGEDGIAKTMEVELPTTEVDSKLIVDDAKIGSFVRKKRAFSSPEHGSGVEVEFYNISPVKKAKYRMINEDSVPLIANRGTPISAKLNVRTIKKLGIGYADPTLKRIKLSNVINTNTAIQVDWLKRAYPEKPIGELLKHLYSVQYAETALTQMGYKIKQIKIGGTPYSINLRSPVTAVYFNGSTDQMAAQLNKYGRTLDDRIQAGFDIEIYVEPSGKSPKAVTWEGGKAIKADLDPDVRNLAPLPPAGGFSDSLPPTPAPTTLPPAPLPVPMPLPEMPALPPLPAMPPIPTIPATNIPAQPM